MRESRRLGPARLQLRCVRCQRTRQDGHGQISDLHLVPLRVRERRKARKSPRLTAAQFRLLAGPDVGGGFRFDRFCNLVSLPSAKAVPR